MRISAQCKGCDQGAWAKEEGAQKKDDLTQPRHPGGLLEGGSRELSFEDYPVTTAV